MSNDEVGVTAIRAVSDLSNSVILGLTSDVHKLIRGQENLERMVHECNDLSKQLTKKVMEMTEEFKKMRDLLHDPTVDALTGPLLEMQKDNRRRRQISSANRAMNQETNQSEHFDWSPLNKKAP